MTLGISLIFIGMKKLSESCLCVFYLLWFILCILPLPYWGLRLSWSLTNHVHVDP